MEARAAASSARLLLFLLSLHCMLAVGVRIKRFPLRNGHIQRFGLITCLKRRAASHGQQPQRKNQTTCHKADFKPMIAQLKDVIAVNAGIGIR